MDVYALQKNLHSIEDYYAMPEDTCVELIDGIFYDMASPGIEHQEISFFLTREIAEYLEKRGGKCRVIQDVDTKLFADKADKESFDIVRPDISVVCVSERIKENRIEGAPDWIIEIVSPSSRERDYLQKLSLYKRSGVREYWIVDPEQEQIIVYQFDKDQFLLSPYGFSDKVKVGIYEDLEIDFNNVLKRR